jgi:hypothetical protein
MADRPASRTFKKSEVLKATKIPNHTFQHWMDRRVVRLSPNDYPGDGKGKPRRFSINTATTLAIAHKISLLGIPANKAVTWARQFTEVPQHGRPLGQPFPIGTTYILSSPDGAASVVCVKPEENVGMLLKDASVVVNVNRVLSEINFELGIIK